MILKNKYLKIDHFYSITVLVGALFAAIINIPILAELAHVVASASVGVVLRVHVHRGAVGHADVHAVGVPCECRRVRA